MGTDRKPSRCKNMIHHRCLNICFQVSESTDLKPYRAGNTIQIKTVACGDKDGTRLIGWMDGYDGHISSPRREEEEENVGEWMDVRK